MKKVWLVGAIIECNKCQERWYLEGIYDDKEKALKACVKKNNFILPREINNSSGPEIEKNWEGCYYPLLETEEEGAERLRNLK